MASYKSMKALEQTLPQNEPTLLLLCLTIPKRPWYQKLGPHSVARWDVVEP